MSTEEYLRITQSTSGLRRLESVAMESRRSKRAFQADNVACYRLLSHSFVKMQGEEH